MVGYIWTKADKIYNEHIVEVGKTIDRVLVFLNLREAVMSALRGCKSFDTRFKIFKVEACEETPDDKVVVRCKACKIIEDISLDTVYAEVNSGSNNVGHENYGNKNIGIRNKGSENKGEGNEGERNEGKWNKGYQNKGNGNNGIYNSGDRNIGCFNNGEANTGSGNSGRNNIGRNNIGFFNIGVRNYGVFNTEGFQYDDTLFSGKKLEKLNKKIFVFNKPTDWTFNDFMDSKVFELLFGKDSSPEDIFKEDFRYILESIPNFDEALLHKILAVYGDYDDDGTFHW